MEHILFLNCAYPLEPLCRSLRACGVVSTVVESLSEWHHLANIRPWSLLVVAAESVGDIPETLNTKQHIILLLLSADSVPQRFRYTFESIFTGPTPASRVLRAVRYGGLLVAEGSSEYATGKVLVSNNEKVLWWEGKELKLTPRQFSIVRLLVSNPGRIFTRSEIWEHCWGLTDYPESNAVDAHLRRIRKRIPSTLANCISSSYGIGYRFLPNSKSGKLVQDKTVLTYQATQPVS